MTEAPHELSPDAAQGLLEKYGLGNGQGRTENDLNAIVQEAYARGWQDCEKHHLEYWSVYELPLSGEALNAALAELSERDRSIVEMRFGLIPGAPKRGDLGAIAKQHDVSRERVRQILDRVLRNWTQIAEKQG